MAIAAIATKHNNPGTAPATVNESRPVVRLNSHCIHLVREGTGWKRFSFEVHESGDRSKLGVLAYVSAL